jgi:hypothetical protein
MSKRNPYRDLIRILNEAVEQAAHGKGKERHACDRPFDRQPIMEIQRLLGSNHFALGQAIKKAQESTRLPKERAKHELIGAIVYLSAAILHLEEQPSTTIEEDQL